MENDPAQPVGDVAANTSRFLGVAAYIGIVSIPAIISAINEPPIVGELVDFGVTLTGVVAYTVFAMQFVLAARFHNVEKSFGYSAVFNLHKTMAVVGTLLAICHVLLLVLSRGNLNLILNPWERWPIQIGRIVVLVLFAILGMSFGRRHIPINNADWLWFHNALAWSVLILGFAHSMVLGASAGHSLFVITWIGYFVLAVVAWIWKRKYRIAT